MFKSSRGNIEFLFGDAVNALQYKLSGTPATISHCVSFRIVDPSKCWVDGFCLAAGARA